ncbi:MAG: B12-binding domain-containing protein [Phycisphaerae bacterium]
MPDPLLIRYMQPLITGRRTECFELIRDALTTTSAEEILCDVIWPAMGQVERLYNDDRINTAIEHMAARINRTVADQLQIALPKVPTTGKRAIVVSAGTEGEELGAQMCTDLLESKGWEVFFVGAGVPHDEILALVGEHRPNMLLIFGTESEQVPACRQLIGLIRDIGVCPTMNIVTSGGIFARADGLWQEMGADVCYPTVRDMLERIDDLKAREPSKPRKSIVKKRNRKRKSTPATATSATTAAVFA